MRDPRSEAPTDAELLSRLRDDDPSALRLLMNRYDRLVRYAVYRISRHRAAQDPIWLDSIASEVWTDLCRSCRERNVKIDNVPSFFIQLARRRTIDALRRHGEAPVGEAGNQRDEQSQPTAPTGDAAESLAHLEDVTALRDCVGVLDEPDRLLCGEIAAIMAGRWKEAGQRLGLPESTLRSRWGRVLERLRECLRKKGVVPRA